MRKPNTIFQDMTVRRRIFVTIGLFVVLTAVTCFYGLMATLETNKRLHESVRSGREMIRAVDTARLAQVHFKKQVQEWKNILLRGNDQILFDKHLRAFEAEEARVNGYLRSLAILNADENLQVPQIEDSIRIHEELGRRYREALASYRRSDLSSAVVVDRMVRGIDREPTDRMDEIVNAIKRQADKRLHEAETSAATKLEAYQVMALCLIFLLLAGVGLGIFSARSIIHDLPTGEREQDPDGAPSPAEKNER